MKALTGALFGAVLALSAGAASNALSGDPEFCRDYARSAVGQFYDAQRHEYCRQGISDFAVWSDDWQHHYDWCLGVSRDAAWNGRRQRESFLALCRHHDWGHPDNGDRYEGEPPPGGDPPSGWTPQPGWGR